MAELGPSGHYGYGRAGCAAPRIAREHARRSRPSPWRRARWRRWRQRTNRYPIFRRHGRRFVTKRRWCDPRRFRARSVACRPTCARAMRSPPSKSSASLPAERVQPALSDGSDYKSNASTIRRNLHSSWVVDSDPFSINQLGHPYQGSMYYGFARSAGLGYWESLGYSLGGSALWEIAGETTPPSRNDLINTGVGGSFLGEALYRMANLVLEKKAWPPILREVGAAIISPAMGFNRLAFGDRSRCRVRESRSGAITAACRSASAAARRTKRAPRRRGCSATRGIVDFAIDYGLPGKPGYTYDRPFDYFTFQATASSANGFENLMTRGLLVGTDYEIGDRLSRRVGALRKLRLLRAADLSRFDHRAVARDDGPGVVVRNRRASGHGAPGSGLRRGRNHAQHQRQRLPLRCGAAGPGRAAPDLRRAGLDRSHRARVFRDARRRRGARRARQHRAARRVVHGARLSPARVLDRVPGQSPRRATTPMSGTARRAAGPSACSTRTSGTTSSAPWNGADVRVDAHPLPCAAESVRIFRIGASRSPVAIRQDGVSSKSAIRPSPDGQDRDTGMQRLSSAAFALPSPTLASTDRVGVRSCRHARGFRVVSEESEDDSMDKPMMGIAVAVLAGAAQAEMITFRQGRARNAARGLDRGRDRPRHSRTGRSSRGCRSAPSAPNVLKQSGSGDFPWCVMKDASLADGFVEVKFKPIAGPRGPGRRRRVALEGRRQLLRRARQRAREQRLALLHRERPAEDDQVRRRAGAPPSTWHTLRVEFHGTRIRVMLDGKCLHRESTTRTSAAPARSACGPRPTASRRSTISPSAPRASCVATASPRVRRILVAKGLRAFGDGYVSLLLPLYLLELGFGAARGRHHRDGDAARLGRCSRSRVGLQRASLRLAHAAARRDRADGGDRPRLRLRHRRSGRCSSIAFVGTLNPSSGDVSVFLPLEHAVLSRARRRPRAHGGVRALQPRRRAGRRGRRAGGRAAGDALAA